MAAACDREEHDQLSPLDHLKAHLHWGCVDEQQMEWLLAAREESPPGINTEPCGRTDINPHSSHKFMRGRKVSQCPGVEPAPTALTWAQGVASHGAGPATVVDIDAHVPGRSEPVPMEIPLADARVLHAMLGGVLAEHDPAVSGNLRQQIAKALHRYDWDHGLSGNDIPGKHHFGEADAVLPVVQAAEVAARGRALTEAAAWFDKSPFEEHYLQNHDRHMVSGHLRRMATEAQPSAAAPDPATGDRS